MRRLWLLILLPWLCAQSTSLDTGLDITTDTRSDVDEFHYNADLHRFDKSTSWLSSCTGMGWDTVTSGDDSTSCLFRELDGDVDSSVEVRETTGQITHTSSEVLEVRFDYEFVQDAPTASGSDHAIELMNGATTLCTFTAAATESLPATLGVTADGSTYVASDDAELAANGDKIRVVLYYDPLDGGCALRVDRAGGNYGSGELGWIRSVTGATTGTAVDEIRVSNFHGRQQGYFRQIEVCSGGCGSAATNTPTIVQITIDDLGREPAAAISTPELDALANVGAIWSVTVAPVCAASRLTLASGQDVIRHGRTSPSGIASLTTGRNYIAHVLREAGYRAELVGKAGLDCETQSGCTWTLGAAPIIAGYQRFWGSVGGSGQITGTDWASWRLTQATDTSPATPVVQSTFQWQAQVDECVRVINQTPLENKLFLECSFNSLHLPAFDPSSAPYADEDPDWCGGVGNTADACEDEMITALDGYIGQIVDAMPNKSRDILVAISDNGTWSETSFDTTNCDGPKGWADRCGTVVPMWTAFGPMADLTTPGDELSGADLPLFYADVARVNYTDFIDYPIDGVSFYDRATGACGTDDCSTTRQFIYTRVANASADTEKEVIAEVGTACRLKASISGGEYIYETSTMYADPDEKTEDNTAPCDAAKKRKMTTQLLAQSWTGFDVDLHNWRSWCYPVDGGSLIYATLCRNGDQGLYADITDCSGINAVAVNSPTGNCRVPLAPGGTGGTYSFRTEGPSNAEWKWFIDCLGGTSTCHAEFYVYPDGSVSQEDVIYAYDESETTTNWTLSHSGTDDVFQLEYEGQSPVELSSVTAPEDAWYKFVIEWNNDDDWIKVKIDNNTVIEFTDATFTDIPDTLWMPNTDADAIVHQLIGVPGMEVL